MMNKRDEELVGVLNDHVMELLSRVGRLERMDQNHAKPFRVGKFELVDCGLRMEIVKDYGGTCARWIDGKLFFLYGLDGWSYEDLKAFWEVAREGFKRLPIKMVWV